MIKFTRCLNVTLSHEGGWSDHPDDPGRATMKGVTQKTYEAYKGRKVTKQELRNIPDHELHDIYRRGYWNMVRGSQLPDGVDLCAFDGAVNSGPVQGSKWVQRAAKMAARDVDGVIGPVTLQAVRSQPPVEIVKRACSNRMGFLQGLRTWSTFGRGWSRRVADVEAHAVVWALAADNRPALPELEKGVKEAQSSANKDQAGVVGTGAGGVSVNVFADLPVWSSFVVLAVVVFTAVILYGHRRHQMDRAAAFSKIANEVKA